MVQTAGSTVAALADSYELAFGFNGYERMFPGGGEPTLRTRPAGVLSNEVLCDLQSVAEWVLRSLPASDRRLKRWLAIAQFTSVPPGRIRGWHFDPHVEDNDAVATLTLQGSGRVHVGVKEDATQQCEFWQHPGSCYSSPP